ncbi:hypothetical protein BCR44DRAFT_235396 [Catenaria anguillulae PL171]|uniref:Uncharacterized protein n=1 Tax=Catenaria anguillulae PL171 TaxID=765915 RepID=A0A1Y2GZ29_9FUNG|nr:hypothetical protein BCR44DRAFT_235396 [Catenaria anguillulae PL171]
MNTTQAIYPPRLSSTSEVTQPNTRPRTKKRTKTALVISSLSRGPTLLDLPNEILHDIHSRAANPLLVETCKSLAHSLLPSVNVRASLRARYLLKRQRLLQVYRGMARTKPDSRMFEKTASQALALGLKAGVLDMNVVRFLDSYAAFEKPTSGQPFRANLRVGFDKWRAMPRWLAQRMLISDPVLVDDALLLVKALRNRGMVMDKGYTVLKMVQQGKLEVLCKLKEIGVPLNVKDGLAVEVAVKEGHMEVALYLLSQEVQPGPGAFEVAIERVCHSAHPPPVESETQLAKRAPGKRAAADEHGSTTSNKRPRKTLSNSSSSAATSLHSRPFAEPSSLELDEFCSLLLTHNAPISDKALAVAIMAFPALSTASLRQVLDGMRQSSMKPSTLAFEAVTHNPKAEKDLIPLLIEYGGVPEFNQVQGIMERLFSL